MPSKAIDEGLLARIRNYVSNDINSRIIVPDEEKVKPEDIFILSFVRVLNNWQADATAQKDAAGYYQLTHDGTSGITIAKIYLKHATHPAII